MKKTLSLLLAALLLLSLAACGGKASPAAPAASDADTQSVVSASHGVAAPAGEKLSLTVTLASAGELVVDARSLSVTDADADGALTLNDALLCAHDAFYGGGAAAGYESEAGDYGSCVKKLWGVKNGGSYGYFINNVSAMNLDEPVKAGDQVYAYSYADLSSWSDAYCWFESCESTEGGLALQLCYLTYDADWNSVAAPVEGAVITVDGERSGAVTDAEGRALLTVSEGAHVLSAVSDTMILTPPAYRLG